jgi:hypothetical protein
MNATTPFHRPRYEHRQTGWAMLGLACIPAVCLGAILLTTPEDQRTVPAPLLIGLAVLTAVVVIGFTSLSVMVTPDHLIARFGIGLFRKTVALTDIVHVEVTRTRWHEGWGIRWTRRGMLYNVAGFDAVRLRLASGRALLIGSDDAPRLAAAIRRAIDDRGARCRAAG